MNESRIWKLAVFGIGIMGYGAWTLFLIFFALMAESGGKNPNPLLAALLLWPLGELVWTWRWLFRNAGQYSAVSDKRRIVGDTLVALALIMPAPLTFMIDKAGPWEFGMLVPAAITIAACHAARLLWSGAAESYWPGKTGNG